MSYLSIASLILVMSTSLNAHAEAVLKINLINPSASVIEGGMSGGGGDALDPGGYVDASQLMSFARIELLLFFKQKSTKPMSSFIAQVVNNSPSMMDIIINTPIYDTYSICQDSHGNTVDGSIYSPYPNTICINSSFMSRFTPEEARKQLLALVAHEYSHLLGLNEVDATSLQREVYEQLEGASFVESRSVVSEARRQFAMARGSIINYKEIALNKNWTRRCQLAHKLSRYLWYARVRSTYFSVLDAEASKLFYSYNVKVRLLVNGTCRFDENEDFQTAFAEATRLHFREKTQMSVAAVSSLLFEEPVSPQILVTRVDSESDFDKELEELRQYIETMYFYSFDLDSFHRKERYPLR